MDEPDYVVIRPGPGLPPGFLPDDVDGRWFDRSRMRLGWPARDAQGNAVAVPAGRFEFREDGAVAEVYEVRV